MNSDPEHLLTCYQRMHLIRNFEQTLSDLFTAGVLGGTSHFCIGQEACAVGVVSECRERDYLVSNHRGHGHLLARGLDPRRVFAELMGRADGYCAGRGGSQHLCALDQGFLGTNGITGGGLPIAVGAALAVQYRHEHDRVVVVFFGDGAANQGAFHESLNMASLWNLRVLFVCENNGYGMSTPVDQSTAGGGVARRATAYNMEGRTVEGIGLMEVKAASAESLEFVRGGSRPFLLELMTYRHCGHSKNDARVYRTREEEEAWKQKDCLGVTRAELERLGVSTHDLDTVEQQALERVQKDADAALALPCGSENDALGGVYA